MKMRVDALKISYDAVKTLGFKGSYTSFAKTIGAVQGLGALCIIENQLSKIKLPAVWMEQMSS